jgi:23S rRNA (adenine2503-C2)-methyltransferase
MDHTVKRLQLYCVASVAGKFCVSFPLCGQSRPAYFGIGRPSIKQIYMSVDLRPNFIAMNREQLADALRTLGVGEGQLKMRVKQLWHWLYIRGVDSFDDMLNISKALREQLSASFCVRYPEIVDAQVSVDGTRKWLVRFPATEKTQAVEVETVYIPEAERGTLCVSSQVGCSLTCTFCHTGTQKMVRNLEASEILGQVMLARRELGDFDGQEIDYDIIAPTAGRRVSNVVMMGMGEPLFNFENVKQALLVALDESGLNFSRRRITLSTSGVVPEIYRTGDETRVMLAISLHATRDELRDVLVPINRKYPLAKLIEACHAYPEKSYSRRITFEYVMLKGVNDSLVDARELVELLEGVPAKINLIPFNPWPGSEYECSSRKTIDAFSEYLEQHGLPAPIRTPRGRDILAACGQLKSESKKSIVELK